MYHQKRSLDSLSNTAICEECQGTRFLYQYSKITCSDCGWSISGSKGNKYGAKRTTANDGIKRDSKYEASVADELYLLKRSKQIKDYDSQFKVEMWAYDADGNKAMKMNHKVDFRVHNLDGSFELIEAKGVETADYKMRRKWLEKFWLPLNKDHTYTVVKQKGRYARR